MNFHHSKFVLDMQAYTGSSFIINKKSLYSSY
jgi:hypothetical protein